MQNDDFNIDVVIAEITAFAENMHAKNQHKKKVCLRCMTSSQESSMSSILRLRKNRLILLLQTVSKHF